MVALLGSKIHELVPDIYSFTDYVHRRFGPVAQVRSAHSQPLVAARWRTTLRQYSRNCHHIIGVNLKPCKVPDIG